MVQSFFDLRWLASDSQDGLRVTKCATSELAPCDFPAVAVVGDGARAVSRAGATCFHIKASRGTRQASFFYGGGAARRDVLACSTGRTARAPRFAAAGSGYRPRAACTRPRARAVTVARVEIDVAFSEAALRAADARTYSTKARIPKIVFSRFGLRSPVARSNVSLETVDTHWGRSCASCDTRNLPDASGSLKVFKYSGSFALIRCRAAADRAVAVRRTVCCTEP
jgi:hypothetical protein